ncbi:beta-lactamase, partial [Ancylostoma duodenale]
AVGALCVAMLVDRGHLAYEDKMCAYWPEFAQHGKENITIDWLMSHRAGLAALDEPISREDAKDFEKMAYVLAKQKPNWEPGTKSGVLIVLGILHLRPPTSIARKVRENPQWFKLEQDVNTFNDPELHGMEQVAALGITKARDLARLFSLMLDGKLFRKYQLLLEEIARFEFGVTMTTEQELENIIRAFWSLRFTYILQKQWLVGHPGFGGSTVMMDMEDEVVVAYVTNGLKTGMGELTRTYRHLRNAVFECLEKEKEESA